LAEVRPNHRGWDGWTALRLGSSWPKSTVIFFGTKSKELDVPVGTVAISWGNTFNLTSRKIILRRRAFRLYLIHHIDMLRHAASGNVALVEHIFGSGGALTS